jgi:hypothetical protein
MGLVQLGTVERLVDAHRVALGTLDRMVGRQCMPGIRLAWMDSWAVGHQRALDDVVGLHG